MPEWCAANQAQVLKVAEHTQRREKALETTFPFLAGAWFLWLLIVSLEAVFQATKASFLSQLGVYHQCAIFFDAFLFIFAPIVVFWFVLYLLSTALHAHPRILRFTQYGYFFLLSLIFFIMTFSHLDTFFYSAFGSDVYELPAIVNLLLVFLLIDASVLLTIKRAQKISNFFAVHKAIISATMLGALLLSSGFAAQKVYVSWREAADLQKELSLNQSIGDRPNILLFAADSLDCRRMGIYGYARDTTPNLNNLENIILFARAYTNCGNSRGSTFSILTGKSPITTKLTFPPDILRGKDALQHLPNILANLGYFNVSINDGYYASPSKSNLMNGFHMENGQRTGFSAGLGFWKKMRIAFSHEGYLLTEMYERHKNKMFYMVGRSSRLYNYARFMIWGEASESTDQERIDILKAAIRETNQPLFAQVHLMTTHGPLFNPPYREFSIQGKESESPELAEMLENKRRQYYQNQKVLQKHNIDEKRHWNLYDDATLSVDHFFGETVQTLKETGKLRNTILIFLTDHGMGMFGPAFNTIKYPLPLIIHLPELKGNMIVQEPVQYLDIAPSILAYLNQKIPDWMEGNIIFGKSGADIKIPDRPIFTVYAGDRKIITTVVGGFMPRLRAEKQDVGPPHFGIGLAGLIMDEKYYIYALNKNSGRLFDVSADSFNVCTIDNRELLLNYHERLYEKLRSREIGIEQKPLTK